MKKFLSAITAMLMSVSCLQLFPVGAVEENLVEGYATGAIQEPLEEYIRKTGSEEITATSETYLESLSYSPRNSGFVDNSTSIYFPPIGHQGELQSCTAWATTYYQFTYEVNKYKGERTTANNIYSPTWTFNYGNGGEDVGVSIGDAYRILKNQGAMKKVDLPYNNTLATYSFDWPTDRDKMIEALEYRATMFHVSATTEAKINVVKSHLANGKIATLYTCTAGWEYGTTNTNESIIVRGSHVDSPNDDDQQTDGAHLMTVVGYNDNITTTINGVTLQGAFKLANSWGTSHGNMGYIWVAYDALLSESAYGTAWQSGYTNPRETFSIGGCIFRFINIQKYDVDFIGWIQFRSKDPGHLSLYGAHGTTIDTENTNHQKWLISKGNTILPMRELRCIAFDYMPTGTSYDLNNYLSSSWSMRLTGNTSYNTSVCANLIDNLGNPIAPLNSMFYSQTNGVYTTTHTINLAKGRVTAYDNATITSADSEMVLNYLTENVELSNLQLFLADYRSDGVVNIQDVIAMNQYIASLSGQSYQITDYIDEWGCSLADVIEEEYNMPIEQYISENYTELSAMNVIPEDLGGDLYAY